MALVMLPCDLPWWDKVKQHLIRIGKIKDPEALIIEMEKIYELCNISLDPDDENAATNLFQRFKEFLENDFTNEERNNFFNRTLPSMVSRALKMKEYKPKAGLHFSLQQQPDYTELDYDFVSSLIANAFFSTFPRRTDKSHPTLRNFNFSNFFDGLDLLPQKSKLKGVLHYFDWLEKKENCMGRMKIMRQVMSGKEWLTIEDWLECSLPLCSVQIKHDGKLERAEANALKICFCSSKIGENVLKQRASQESINLITFPEILTTLLNVEALEDNEVLTIENARHVTRINDPKHKATLEKLEYPYMTSICCMDADDYTKLPIGQYEEDNILRELNKCLLAFQQRQTNTNNNSQTPNVQASNPHKHRRLSPIGESRGSGKNEKRNMVPMITQQSCSTIRSDTSSVIDNNNVCNNRLQVQNNLDRNVIKKIGANSELVHNRRGRFIVLGSSGECLPVTRRPLETMRTIYSSCDSSEEEFHSAKTSLDESEEDNFNQKYSIDLDTSESRHHFAKKLKDALKSEAEPESSCSSTSYDSSFAVGISVTGSGVRDENIKVRREGSTGFALREDSLDEYFLQDSLQQEKKWIDKFKNKHSVSNKKESNKSSEYSFSTEYSSEMEELYEQFSKWLEDPVLETERGTRKELDNRELAVVKFAGSLLKRTLSESFAGVPVPLTEELAASNAKNNQSQTLNRNRLVLNAKSLSLELARHKHRLAAQLMTHKASRTKDAPALHNDKTKRPTKTNKKRNVWFVTYDSEPMVQTLEDVSFKITLPKASPKNKMSQISSVPSGGLRPIATGNWGCGSSRKGDVQIKVIIQWLAASVAGVPSLIYFTCGHQQMSKLDTVCRILLDRKWCVKDLTKAILKYSNQNHFVALWSANHIPAMESQNSALAGSEVSKQQNDFSFCAVISTFQLIQSSALVKSCVKKQR